MNTLPKAIFLMGPTASGKTAIAVELAQRLPVELISVDSALVFRDMDIGTAKPDAATLAVAPHHLIDIISPTEVYSAAQFRTDALRLMAEITARGNVPLLVGGTMLYFNALQHGLHDLPRADVAIRAELEAEATTLGWPAMHAKLAQVDPVTAARLSPNDSQRLGRALEIYRISGKPMSQWLAEQTNESLPYDLLKLALLAADRAILHERIALRFEQMLAGGLIDEVAGLRENYPLQPDMPSMRCVGYRQAWQYLDGEIDLVKLRDTGIYATRQLAKRQITWLRGMEGNLTFDLNETLQGRVVEQVRQYVELT
ncbi:tRNA (adenosine(37)-N6)-dimethylallyltransferase MiaA [Chitinimonas sp. BJB300]|uniref:tRNA (adenosine(37)-N6)-dimethylallyltransferase MiaA n=1 Tax=Chitinimonas sp. BJB300 TaxID=1559339 RepID=UPI000C10A477|nr:tRNA (adenosine(37)-N6)-dimethylallyltransferase MiaA [Chitinimonas sp. BJB300]PHV13438.1 tRNA (adenosine(37)-N6)-dimethylallyltransferase MiaA [Chitinimonas sp. BJB300]TSJ89757.1 tRNA (adenosine(37)-N6)-dimethylallyltransferase MiaA [Chitinimonas sp. BJB300]